MHPQNAKAQTEQALSKALELDELMPEAHAIRAVLRASGYDWQNAEQNFLYALELDPHSEDVYRTYILHYLLPTRRLDEAFHAAQKTIELGPLSAYPQFLLGYCFYVSRQWDLVIEYCQRAIEFDPNSYLPYQYIGFAHLGAGRLDEAIKACETAAGIVGKSQWALAIPGAAYARAGMIEEAHRLLKELYDLSDKT